MTNNGGIREEFEKAFNREFGEASFPLKPPTEEALWAARWMAERCAKEANKWGHDRGMQFGCAGSQERSGAMHRGIGTKDCPKILHHHHDERCQSPGDMIRALANQLE